MERICADCGCPLAEDASPVQTDGEWKESYLCPTCIEYEEFLQEIGDAKAEHVKPFHERTIKKGAGETA